MEELEWEEYLPLTDREQLGTEDGTHTLNTEKIMDILTHTHTHRAAHTSNYRPSRHMNFSAVVAMAIH